MTFVSERNIRHPHVRVNGLKQPIGPLPFLSLAVFVSIQWPLLLLHPDRASDRSFSLYASMETMLKKNPNTFTANNSYIGSAVGNMNHIICLGKIRLSHAISAAMMPGSCSGCCDVAIKLLMCAGCYAVTRVLLVEGFLVVQVQVKPKTKECIPHHQTK